MDKGEEVDSKGEGRTNESLVEKHSLNIKAERENCELHERSKDPEK